ncbi:GNAT family N-acetyltransferase [Roseateles oligotrophus]|uniref:GNAT family N-acetyltransferase n=1 Tax=Roseateles oligotrophus TaxID=1769250 RepID=A0ABT2YCG0_9BURK|nr:GNAT family N-acetyltransferase [Roseateles oligotrophus]MCV2367717.1 GNAT family N-acetyltransferase [Roseateles oligotrophus]
MHLEILRESNQAVFDALVAGVRAHNFELLGQEVSKPLLAIGRDDEGKLLGGVAGRTIYKQFLIEVVWVDRCARGSGLGRKLMAMAETEARQRGCVAAQVDTLAVQAPDFYAKLGFEVVGRVTELQDSPERLFLLKRYL